MAGNVIFLEIIDTYNKAPPRQLISAEQHPNTIYVKRFVFALENVISQLQKRIPDDLESLVRIVSFKYSGPQRHQQFWKRFRQAAAILRKYNNKGILKFMSDLCKKLSSSSGSYMPTNDSMRYIAAAYLSQLCWIDKLRTFCILTTRCLLGYVERGHWKKLSVFIIGLCADLASRAKDQATAIANTYDNISEFVVQTDSRFPKCARELDFGILNEEAVSHSEEDLEKVLELVQLGTDDVETARTEEKLDMLRKSIVDQFLGDEEDFGISITRDMSYSVCNVREEPSTSFSEAKPSTPVCVHNAKSPSSGGKATGKKLKKRPVEESNSSVIIESPVPLKKKKLGVSMLANADVGGEGRVKKKMKKKLRRTSSKGAFPITSGIEDVEVDQRVSSSTSVPVKLKEKEMIKKLKLKNKKFKKRTKNCVAAVL